jgi:gag-polypeptide of LTR copia-type
MANDSVPDLETAPATLPTTTTTATTKSSSIESNALKLIMFSGKKADWDSWFFGFETRATFHGYKKILKGKEVPVSEDEYDNLDEDSMDLDVKKKIKTFKLNMLAFSHLVSSVDTSNDAGKVVMNMLRTCTTKDLPGGDAKMAVDTLCGYYNVRSVVSAQMLLNKYYGMELKGNQEPSQFIAKMQNIRVKIEEADKKQAIDERSFLLRILNKLPQEYEATVLMIESEIDEGNVPSINTVVQKLVLQYQRNLSRKGSKKGGGDDVALYGGGGFKGNCNKCGKRGHKGVDCKADAKSGKGNDKNKKGQSQGQSQSQSQSQGQGQVNHNANVICNYCKAVGHMKVTCPKLAQKNANKSEEKTGDTLCVAIDPYTKMSKCDHCDDVGFHGWQCNCTMVSKFTRLIARKELETLNVGCCPECGDVMIDSVGTFCTKCEDGAVVYEEVSDLESMHGGDIEEEWDLDDEGDGFQQRTVYPIRLEKHAPPGMFPNEQEIIEGIQWHRDDLFEAMYFLTRGNNRLSIRAFLQFVGELMSPEMDPEYVRRHFVFDYVFNLVNLSIETVSHLMSVILSINELLASKGWHQFDARTLAWICALAPLWIRAEATPTMAEPIIQEDVIEADVVAVDYSYFAGPKKTSKTSLWIGDTGASCHMTCSMEGMFNVRDINSPVQVGTGQSVPCGKIGDKRVRIIQEDGTMNDMILKDCKFVPGLFTNLFSITKAADNGWSISNQGIVFHLEKNGFRLLFDKTLRTDTGAIVGVEIVPRTDGVNLTLEQGLSVNINKLHLLMGHACEKTIRATAKYYGVKVTRQFCVCSDCTLAKARQKNVDKEGIVSTSPGERFYLDISSTTALSFGGAQFWLLVIDHFTDMCWSFFLKAKSDLAEKVCGLFMELRRDNNLPAKPIIRCDNSGENQALQALLRSKDFNVQFEYTAPGSPQFAGVVERKFATLYA